MDNMKKSAEDALQKYVDLARRFGFAADYRLEIGTDVVQNASEICAGIKQEFPRSVVFMGQLTFSLEKLYHRILHNETAFSIQKRLHWAGITSVILPIRVDIARPAPTGTQNTNP